MAEQELPPSMSSKPRPMSSKPRPMSARATQDLPVPDQSSLLISMLPSMVQNRLPRLPSLRRSVSMYGLKGRKKTRSSPTASSDDQTALVLSNARADVLGKELATADYLIEDASSGDEYERGRPERERRRPLELTEGKSGIGWKFAGQGFTLLTLSINESAIVSQKPSSANASASFIRHVYINAITYLLRGLPTDLTTEEQICVRSALPQGVVSPMRVEVVAGQRNLLLKSNAWPQGEPRATQPSVLHRTLANTIINLFLFLQFVLPYIKILLRAAYDYERTHRITEKVLVNSIETVDCLGKLGIRGGNALLSSGLALGFGELLTWTIEGVSGGIQEGLGEGMARVGVRKDMEARDSDDL